MSRGAQWEVQVCQQWFFADALSIGLLHLLLPSHWVIANAPSHSSDRAAVVGAHLHAGEALSAELCAPVVENVLQQARYLKDMGATVIVVTEGPKYVGKVAIDEARLVKLLEAFAQENHKGALTVPDCLVVGIKLALEAEGILFLDPPCEADAQLAALQVCLLCECRLLSPPVHARETGAGRGQVHSQHLRRLGLHDLSWLHEHHLSHEARVQEGARASVWAAGGAWGDFLGSNDRSDLGGGSSEDCA